MPTLGVVSTTDRDLDLGSTDLESADLGPDGVDEALGAVDDEITANGSTANGSGVNGSTANAATWLDTVEATLDETDIDARQSPSSDVLEELRRGNVDGPMVAPAPQDDTSSAMRRPKRAADFDPAPVPVVAPPPRLLGRRPRVRRVTRVVRHVDPWSVFKIAAVASLVLYLVVLTAGVLLWNVAYATGTIDNVERFLESFGWSTFEFNGGEIYHNAWIGGLFVAVGLTGFAVLLATLFNLITDLVGGMRFTVLEEEVVESRTSPMRRFVIRRPEPEIPLVISTDDTGPTIREAVVDDAGAIDRPAR